MKYPKLCDIRSELEVYAEMCNDEFGEYALLLCSMTSNTDVMSDSFREEFEEEIQNVLNYFKQHSKIVITTKTSTFEELEWND